MEINLPFDSSEQTMELIKLAALYYDRVNVWCPKESSKSRRRSNRYYSQALLSGMLVLQESGIITQKPFIVSDHKAVPDNFYDISFSEMIDWVMSEVWDESEMPQRLKLAIDDEQVIDGCLSCHADRFAQPKLRKDECNEAALANSVAFHCVNQLVMTYNLIRTGQNCISSNEIIDKAIDQWFGLSVAPQMKIERETASKATKQRAMERVITPILLPNFSNLEYEDILEMRLKASDELQQLRCYISELSSKYDPDDTMYATVKDFIERDIRRAVEEFESKVTGLRIEIIQKMLKGFANPWTYAPMLATFFLDIPLQVSLAASMGLIFEDVALEYLKQKKELTTAPLYFTVKLKKYGKG